VKTLGSLRTGNGAEALQKSGPGFRPSSLFRASMMACEAPDLRRACSDSPSGRTCSSPGASGWVWAGATTGGWAGRPRPSSQRMSRRLMTMTALSCSTSISWSLSLKARRTFLDGVEAPALARGTPLSSTVTLLNMWPQELPKSSVNSPEPPRVSATAPMPSALKPQYERSGTWLP